MHWVDFRLRLHALFRREVADRDLDDELTLHIEMQTRRNRERGMEQREARRQALVMFGSLAQATEQCRDARGIVCIEETWRDVRQAARSLRRNPLFTTAAVVTLALGVGMNTAIFSVTNAVMLEPLPFDDPDRLVRIYESNPQRGWPEFSASDPNFLDWHARATSWDALAAFDTTTVSAATNAGLEVVAGLRVTQEFLSVLGVQPALGRDFLPEDTQPGADHQVTIISDELWRRVFDADPGAVGAELRVNNTPHTIIGVLPPRYGWEDWTDTDLLSPRMLDPHRSRGDHQLAVIGRLTPQVTIEEARAELAALAAQLAQEHPDDNYGWTVRLVPFRDWLLPQHTRDSLMVLQGAVLLVLLIACLNVANLLLVRGVARQRETAIRAAVGASRVRLVRHGLVESGVLALIGAAMGVGLATLTVRVLSVHAAAVVPRADEAATDWRVLGFALGCSVMSAVAFGVLPSLRAAREHRPALHDTHRGTIGGRDHQRVRTSLTVAEVALSVALLIGAGLLLRSFVTLQQVDVGFEVEGVMTGRIMPASEAEFDTPEERLDFWHRATAAVAAIPGISSSSTASGIPLGPVHTSTEIAIPGTRVRSDVQPSADWRVVTPGYFAVMGIPLRGRDFTAADGPDAPPVIIVSATLARRHWPGEDPIGKTIVPTSLGNRARTVIGVAGDVREVGLDEAVRPMVYYSGLEAPVFSRMYLVWRSAVDPQSHVPAIRYAIRRINPHVALYDLAPAAAVLSDALGASRFTLYLLGLFAVVAGALAAIGLFGVTAYLVSHRTREIGVRLALGATRAEVFRTVLGQGVTMAAAGAGMGVIAAAFLTRVMDSLLFAISPTDPVIFTAVPTAMVAVAVVACYVPARRATRVDPVIALRSE